MDAEELQKWNEAGKLAAESLQYGASLIKNGELVREVLDKIEEKIHNSGAIPAFPAQISLDHVAAHFCPEENDDTAFDNNVVCLDVGVQVDGYMGDNALSIDLSGKNQDLVDASREALNNVIKILKPGITLGEIGKTIQEAIQSKGFAPVRNLSGHGLARYTQHTKPTIPNFDTKDSKQIENGMAFAIEPFASAGAGIVQDSGAPTLFMLSNEKPVRSMIARQVLKEVRTYDGLPFTTRWLTKKFGAKAKIALREMMQAGMLHDYAPLADQDKGWVSQAEHTFVIFDDEVHITTKI